MATWVVKLGGSLYHNGPLRPWLTALSGWPAIIVPGGGPYADQVRAAQQHWQFSDAAAHRMALLAMAQFGMLLADVAPGIGTANSLERLREIHRAGQPVIWLPEPGVLAGSGIPECWDVTSDSLAAWIAGQIQATDLLLVKSARLSDGSASVDKLSQEGIVDRLFGQFISRSTFNTWLTEANLYATVGLALSSPADHFVHCEPRVKSG